ncbi:putative DNA-binding pseudobarrel domain superfamily [Helianthus annuus]|uniref:DNA-binding pseudobarrel domain superfamily n=1 Tax=Helianthus annuus TaxID=4232 RepID=A0A9K3HTT2_HELAN|nr:putative DNA-binding pseudobarrel domain superfamily [Helianthus annuus]KAJ0511605.1 putative DNA-binding pseudobarrel domain superfamily [Helianthus annuus]KAJ0519272.1 putative DNA-binding pseudobarrel domain superfamily [Helianthus annuus]
MGHRSRKIHGSRWIRFLECHKHKNIAKLCFKKLKEAKFEVFVLSDEGFEIRKDGNGKDYVYGCLVRASEETYYKQDLPYGLLWLLLDRQLKIDHLLAKVHGPKQSSKVDVCYVFTTENPKSLAAGFMGSGWTTFCFENDIEEGCQLLFQWMGSTPVDHFNFNVNIFNKNGVGLQVTAEHQCTRSNHRHNKRRPTYKKQIQYHVTKKNYLTIPKKFVRDNQLNRYSCAVLSFGHVKFLVPLRVKTNDRQAADDTHLVMVTDWQHILDKTGCLRTKY